MLLRLGTLLMMLSLAVVTTVFVATAIYGEPGEPPAEVKNAEQSLSSPKSPAEPKKVVEKSKLPEIQPESADLPEVREKKEPVQKAPPPTPKPPAPEPPQPEPPQPEPLREEDPAPEPEKPRKAEPPRDVGEKKAEPSESRQLPERPEKRKLRSLPAEASRKSSTEEDPAGKAKADPEESKTGAAGGRSKQLREARMSLGAERIGLRKERVESTSDEKVLDEGLIHLPQTSMPWDRAKSRNVYVVGHRVGWPDTGSWKLFYRLNELKRGDGLTLTDRRGKTYRYKVSEKLVVSPRDVWVTEPVKGRDMLSLQTCTGPNFSQRLIVRADRV